MHQDRHDTFRKIRVSQPFNTKENILMGIRSLPSHVYAQHIEPALHFKWSFERSAINTVWYDAKFTSRIREQIRGA